MVFAEASGKMHSAKEGQKAAKAADEVEDSRFSDPEQYLEHLLKDGSQEGDSGAALELPSWYDEQLFRR